MICAVRLNFRKSDTWGHPNVFWKLTATPTYTVSNHKLLFTKPS